MDYLIGLLTTIWGRLVYLVGQPIQNYNQWAFDHPAYYLLMPEMFLALAVLLVIAVWVFSRKENYNLITWIAIGGAFTNFLMTLHMMLMTSRYFSYGLGTFWGGIETIDPFALFFKQLMDWGDIFLYMVLLGYGLIHHSDADGHHRL
jgi:hypothetical protein